MNVGVIGLGAMGFPMVQALLASGNRVLAFDVAEPALDRSRDAGAEIAASPAEVGSRCEIVLLSLPTPAHVEAVATAADGLLASPAPGLVVVDTSTVDPDSTRRMATVAAGRGIGWIDAPILGRPDACGRWTFPAGGDAEALERARPALEPLAARIVQVGPSGAGNALKLLNNLMFGAINAVTAEAMAACEAVGITPATFFETVAGSEAATVSPLFRVIGRKMVEADFDPIFTVDLMRKDVALAVAMLAAAGLEPRIGETVLAQIDAARAAGLGAEDSSAIVKSYRAPTA